MKDITEFRKLSTSEKLDEIYIALTNHLGTHKFFDAILVAVFIAILSIVIKTFF